jgi:hypothetical protein
MGQSQHTRSAKPVRRNFSQRLCLRKGCGQRYQPRCWNQRYCQDPDCLQEVRRWQAAKRQRDFRASPENRKRHAEAEARRREAKKAAAAASTTIDPAQDPAQETPSKPRRGRAWSRSNRIPEYFCDRIGCYDPLPTNSRAPVRYCGGDCRQAMRRVRDRERKWLLRHGDTLMTHHREHASASR